MMVYIQSLTRQLPEMLNGSRVNLLTC